MELPFVAEELAELKRKDLISLCKKFDIKCVGKNSELIEKLMELNNQSDDKPDDKEATIECEITLKQETIELEEVQKDSAEKIQDRQSFECEIPLRETIEPEEVQTSSVEQIQDGQSCVQDPQIEASSTEAPCVNSLDQNDENLKDVIEKAKETFVEPIETETPQAPIESPAKSTERRQSLRLSAIHKAGAMATPKAASKLGQSFIPKPEAGMKRTLPQKENVLPSNQKTTPSNIPVKVNALRPINKTAAAKRPKFDIKESLKRPLSYKPYSGPLPKLSQ